ncbi:thioesterase II family protein [Lentzea sp. NPDC054927]
MTVMRDLHVPEVISSTLVCFPHAGGRTDFFQSWPEHLPAGMAMKAVEYPGRGHRGWEQNAADLFDLVDQAVSALNTPQGSPLVLFGHSMGALVAFETTRRLSTPPAALIVSGKTAPNLAATPTLPSTDDEIWAHSYELGGIPDRLHRNALLKRLTLPSLRADYLMLNSYRHRSGPLLTCPIIACHALDDPITRASDLDRWGDLTESWFGLECFPGGHFYLTDVIPELVSVLSRVLPDNRSDKTLSCRMH